MQSDQTSIAEIVRLAVASTLASLPTVERIAFTIDEAAAATGLPRNTLRDAVSRGELRAVKRCSRWIIKRTDLLQWLTDA